MKGFRDTAQRQAVCEVMAAELRTSGCGFVPMGPEGPTIAALEAWRTRARPRGGSLSDGQCALLGVMLDTWQGGLAGVTMIALDAMDPPVRRAVGMLVYALACSPDHVDEWMTNSTPPYERLPLPTGAQRATDAPPKEGS